MSIWINKTNYHVTKKYALLISTMWMMGLCQHCLCTGLCMQREGDKGLNVSQLQELYFTWCALEMQYLNLQTKARLLRGAFACKHQVVVWNTVLSEHFEALRTGRIDWDGSHFLLKMWVSWFPMTIYLENLSKSILKSNRIVVRRTMAQNTWRGMMQGEEMLDEISIIYWMSLQNIPILCTT